jgi:ATP-binding cassette subfamily C protein CydD
MAPLDPRLVRRSRPVRTQLVVSTVLGAAGGVAIVAQAWLLAATITRGFAGDAVGGYAAALLACFAARALLRWGQTVTAARAAVAVKSDLRRDVTDALLDPRRLGPRPSSSRVLTLMTTGLDALDAYIGTFLPQLVVAVLVPGTVLVAVAVADPLAAVTIGLTLPLVVVFMVLIGTMTRDRVERRWSALQRLGRHFADVLDGLEVLKVFGRRQEEGLRRTGEAHRHETMRALRVAFLSALVLDLMATISVALVAVFVGLRVVEGHMGLEVALFVLLLAPEAYLPVRQVGAMFHDSEQGVEAARDALDLLDYDRATGHAAAPDLRTSTLTFEDVVVVHDGRSAPALDLPALVLRPGEFVALAGPSGSGKSTALAVLLGFIAPSAGRVRVGSALLEDLDPDAWRSRLAWVSQYPAVVHGTVADNVRLGTADATDADVARALRDAGAGDLRPDRVLGEDGRDVSAGERRRLGIARAVLRVRHGGAQLVLLDEPTAGLDRSREDDVLAMLRGLGATVLVVSHHRSTLDAADRVVDLTSRTAVPA